MSNSDSSNIEITSQMTHYVDLILMSLASSYDPLSAIVRYYDQAKDKDVFMAAMAHTLLLRHKQWQVLLAETRKKK